MGKTKTTTQGTTSGTMSGTQSGTSTGTTQGATTNTYGWEAPPTWAGLSDLSGFQFSNDPSIGYSFASAKNRIANSFNNPIGGIYSPQMRDQILRSSLSDLSQKEAEAHSEDAYKRQGLEYQKRLAIAGMTAPKLVQTGGTMTGTTTGTTQGTTTGTTSGTTQGTTTQSIPWWIPLLQGAGQAAGAFAGGLEKGGMVSPGQVAMVGEKEPEYAVNNQGMSVVGQEGPEMFAPHEDTLIIPPELLSRRMKVRRTNG